MMGGWDLTAASLANKDAKWQKCLSMRNLIEPKDFLAAHSADRGMALTAITPGNQDGLVPTC